MTDRARFAAWAVEQGFSRADLDTLSPPAEREGEYQNHGDDAQRAAAS